MKKATKLSLFTFLIAVLSISFTNAQIIIDGSLSETEYISIASKQNSNSGFGSSIDVSEIFYYSNNDTLYLGIEGKLEDGNSNGIGIWLNIGSASGVSSGANLGFSGGGHYMDGEGSGTNDDFKADFEVDYMFALNSGVSGSVFVDAAELVGGNTSQFLATLNQNGTSVTNSNSDFWSTGSATLAFNNGGGANQGFEIAIPHSEIGISGTTTIEAFAFVVSATGFFSDVTVPGNNTSGNSGFNTDYSSLSGGDYVSSAGAYGNVSITGDAGWRLLSLPIENWDLSDISDDTAIQGVTGGSNAAADTNVATFDASGLWEIPASITTEIPEGTGIAVYFFDNTTAGSTELPITLDASGSEPTGNVAVTLNSGSTGLYTLVGNPYASNLNLSNNFSADGVIGSNVSFWDNSIGSYVTESATNGDGFIIKPWQAFWVVTGNGSTTNYTFNETGKTTGTDSASYFGKVASKDNFELSLQVKSSYNTDKALKIQFQEDASLEWDIYDFGKFIPLIPQYANGSFVGLLDNERVLKSVESLPSDLKESVTLPLSFELVGEQQEVTFDWKGLESIPSDWKLTFHDYELGTSIDMREMEKYSFDASSPITEKVNPLSLLSGLAAIAQKSKGDGTRFGITITPNTTSVNNEPTSKVTEFALEQNYPNPFNPSTTINYSVENSGAVTLSVYNLMGQKVAELVNGTKAQGSYNVTWNASGAASGMYYYRLEAGGQTLTRKMTLIK